MVKGDIPEIDLDHPTNSEQEQRAYYEGKGIVFLEDAWSLWHIRVWVMSRENNGFGSSINAAVVFAYARKYRMDEIDTLERIRHIERGVNSD